MNTQDPKAILEKLQSAASTRVVSGLSAADLAPFMQNDAALLEAINAALIVHNSLSADERELLLKDELSAATDAQHGIHNFYPRDLCLPFIPLAARGPWIITARGAVVYDAGGYGMLGLGHNHPSVLAALSKPQVMANTMTPSFAQRRLLRTLFQRIGENRANGCPYESFVFLNSGSEAMTVALRISDASAKVMTDEGGKYAAKRPCFLALSGSFHGRTCRPAQVSASSQKKYSGLASFRGPTRLWTIEMNDIAALEAAFERMSAEGIWFEAFVMEPVMGEGKPGTAATPAFYARARELTEQYDTLFIVDSIQAGLRAHGVLSIVDYPGFETLRPPDVECFAKAINAGQFPLSALALSEKAARLLTTGLYGNTMTANPRALDVAAATLHEITPKVRENIRRQGVYLKERYLELARRMPLIKEVTGTGLLIGIEIDERVPVGAVDGLQQRLRCRGLNVIPGGKNAIRLTPHFQLSTAECDLIVRLIGEIIEEVAFKEPASSTKDC